MGRDNLFKKCLSERILILDGAMGTMIQEYGLDENDYRGDAFKNLTTDLKGNNEILSLTRPDIIESIHREYLKAGADIIEANTFGANSISQKDYGLESSIKELNKASVRIAKKVAKEFSTDEKPRFVAGSIGPTTKSASISPDVMNPAKRDVTFDELVISYKEQTDIMAQEGIDLFLIETAFDTLNVKAAICAIKQTLTEQKKEIPLIISATLTDKSGRTMSGQTLESFYYSIEYSNPAAVGLNCSMGIESITPHIKELSKISNCAVSVYANAGLPNENGKYEQLPEKMAKGYEILAKEGCINIAGGCCGTTPEHIKKISEVLKKYPPRQYKTKREFSVVCGLDSFHIDGSQNFVVIGERANVTGSKKFATLIREKKFDEGINIARRQIENGANITDICMDSELSEPKDDMTTFLNLVSSEPEISKAPIMIDSSDFEVIESGLKCIQSKPLVNSISLKVGEDEFIRQAKRIKDFGGIPVVMAFDENGQATGINDRVEIVSRAYNILTGKCGYNPYDITFDLNIYPLATGMKEHNSNAVNFINALKILKEKYPQVMFMGGVSNISFSFRGMNYIREAIHTVFLYHAIKAGLTMSIVNAAKLIRYEEIDENLRDLTENLVLNKTDDAGEKLLEYAQNIEDNSAKPEKSESERKIMPVERRIQNALIKGDTTCIDEDLEEALNKYKPVEIIEKILLEGMNEIGEKFGAGKMFLPQVVKASRIMKEIVDKLENKFSKSNSQKIGTIVLATVKGDVHDIGKNILSLILKCNNFEVIDLGVMVNCSDILKSAKEYKADIVALSGLITPSLNEMEKVAQEMEKEGLSLPALMVGGATTSKRHTALKIAPNYKGLVVHTQNASEAAVVAQKIVMKDNEFIEGLKKEQKEILEEWKNEKHN